MIFRKFILTVNASIFGSKHACHCHHLHHSESLLTALECGIDICFIYKHYIINHSDCVIIFISGVKKMTAKAAKTVKYGSSVDGISTVEPDQYAKRFLAFMDEAIE